MSFTFRMAWDWSLFIDRKGKGGGGGGLEDLGSGTIKFA